MSSFNGDTYTDRQVFEAHARALRRAEFDRLAGIARAGLALTLHRLRALAVRGARSVADASLAVSPRRGAH
jgi:hypothetical protein